ncbi:MAG: hypothetical protein GTO51_02920 [Candidatus Latescibacteria bacterium]|nr:hypothetical protein [Candidatus Latescibacterota bacterium]NIM22636.1 hypothetical protein [Candidatus Latescibacterota bacterium]NIM64925.1 hypothetical protein [Candidatus Latescibacterota bacterium]NIO01440.1 hypothetical protein [Candidatus Latescibacterota bacterium]NIO27950.1 hypothetical protein [Candidatus Latescibacterota bacterium]
MRIDLLLKYLCLVKSRSIAKSLCENGAIRIGVRRARPSSAVREGDRLTLELRGGSLLIEVLEIPKKQLSRSAAPQYYQRIEWTPRSTMDEEFWEEDR